MMKKSKEQAYVAVVTVCGIVVVGTIATVYYRHGWNNCLRKLAELSKVKV